MHPQDGSGSRKDFYYTVYVSFLNTPGTLFCLPKGRRNNQGNRRNIKELVKNLKL